MVLLLFSFSIIIFQMSCKKSASAQSSNSTVTTVAFIKVVGGNAFTSQIWIGTSTGGSITQVPIPSTYVITSVENIVTNGIVLFSAQHGTSPVYTDLFSCKIDGSNITQLTTEPSTTTQIYF